MLSWPSWLTCSGRLTHISGHPSAADRAWDSESSPVKDERSNHSATQPTKRCHDSITKEPIIITSSNLHGGEVDHVSRHVRGMSRVIRSKAKVRSQTHVTY